LNDDSSSVEAFQNLQELLTKENLMYPELYGNLGLGNNFRW
jgi:hypothetical protein